MSRSEFVSTAARRYLDELTRELAHPRSDARQRIPARPPDYLMDDVDSDLRLVLDLC